MMRMLALLAVLFAAAPPSPSRACPPAPTRRTRWSSIPPRAGSYVKLRNDLAPKHAERLKQLARDKFYDNVPFHRVIAGFMAQTGDGQNGNGTGGSKYPDLPAEFSNVPFKRGVVGMARSQRSQFGQQPVLHHVRGRRRSSTASTRWSARCCPAWTSSTSSRRASGQNGSVTAPDKMTTVRVAADAK